MNITKKHIKEAIILLSLEFDETARMTILKNLKKHIHEVSTILAYTECFANPSILDIGGGMGVNLLVLSKLNYKSKLYLVERFDEYEEGTSMGKLSKDTFVRFQNYGINVVKQDFVLNNKLNFENYQFNMITIIDVIEHIPHHPIYLLKECYRILKKDSFIILSSPNLFGLSEISKFLLGKHIYIKFDVWIREKYYSHFREYTQNEHSKLLELAKFKVIQVNKIDYTIINSYKTIFIKSVILFFPFMKGIVLAIGKKNE